MSLPTYLQINQPTLSSCIKQNPDHNSTQKGLEINRRNKIYSHVICFTFQNTTTALIMPTHSFVTDFTSHTRNVNTNRVHKSRWLCQFPKWNVRWVNQVNIYIGRIDTCVCVCQTDPCVRIGFVCLIYYNLRSIESIQCGLK